MTDTLNKDSTPLSWIEQSGISWEREFTDPLEHNPEKFTYLVHGVMGGSASILMRNYIARSGRSDPSQDIDTTENIYNIGNKVLISASVIDQDHLGTWGSSGWIIQAPFDNVLSMSNRDQGSDFTDPAGVLAKGKGYRMTIRDLMKITYPSTHNDVLLTGLTAAGRARVIGAWCKLENDGRRMDLMSEYDIAPSDKILDLAHKKGLPMIFFQKKEGTEEAFESWLEDPFHPPPRLIDNPFGRTTIGVTLGGSLYQVSFAGEKAEFFVWEGGGRGGHRMTPGEWKTVKSILDSKLIPPDKRKLADRKINLDSLYNNFVQPLPSLEVK